MSTDAAPSADSGGGRPSDPVRDPTAEWERYEYMARTVNRTLNRLALSDRELRIDLSQLAVRLQELVAQTAAWSALHRLLHAVLVSLEPFHAGLSPAAGTFSALERQGLLQQWRPCQARLDTLADFAERARVIGQPFEHDRYDLRGEPWAVEPIAYRLLVEDALNEDSPDPQSLQELMDDYESTCRRHLETADRGLQESSAQLQRLLATLVEGMGQRSARGIG